MIEPQFHYILHADLNAFYAPVEQVDDLSLQGEPVAVGGPPESRGVVPTVMLFALFGVARAE